jgi:hypothetical protein
MSLRLCNFELSALFAQLNPITEMYFSLMCSNPVSTLAACGILDPYCSEKMEVVGFSYSGYITTKLHDNISLNTVTFINNLFRVSYYSCVILWWWLLSFCCNLVEFTFTGLLGSDGRSQWPRGLAHELSSLARTLRSWVRIPLKAWMSLCVYSVFVLFYV